MAPDTITFTKERLFYIRDVEDKHFWFAGRRRLIENDLCKCADVGSSRIIDIGCGTGFMLKHLFHAGHRVIGVDRRPESIALLKDEIPQIQIAVSDAEDLPFMNNSFDIVLMTDVLEHLVNDDKALSEAGRVLCPGGWAIITVPAYQWLWSDHDVIAAHRRRYSKQGLLALLKRHNFEPVNIKYYQCILFPIVIINRCLRKYHIQKTCLEGSVLPLVNTVLSAVNRFEIFLGKYIRWPYGSSLVVLCRRNTDV